MCTLLLIVIVVADGWLFDGVMFQQLASVARVFAGDQVCLAKHAQGATSDVFKVADGSATTKSLPFSFRAAAIFDLIAKASQHSIRRLMERISQPREVGSASPKLTQFRYSVWRFACESRAFRQTFIAKR